MAKFNLLKRNKVIRKYCPELFEKEPRSDKGKLLGAGDVPIDALMLVFDEAGQPTDAWAVKNHLLQNIFSNDEAFQRSFCTVRARHLETDTIVFDIGEISREAGRDMTTEIFRAACDRPYRLRGMTQRQIAHALLNPVALQPERPSRSSVESLSLEEFFDGNQDDSSIAPNAVGHGHAGIRTFHEALLRIRSQSGVLDVRIRISSASSSRGT